MTGKKAAPRTRRSASAPPGRLPYVKEVRAGGATYLYYSRAGTRIALPGPEGSEPFRIAYDQAHRSFGAEPDRSSGRHTVDDAITAYLASAEYRLLKPKTRSDYRRTLDRFRGDFGPLALAALTEAWIDRLRAQFTPDPDSGAPGQPIEWNHLRSRMILVTRVYRKQHPGVLAANPWEASGRLRPPPSSANLPWPPATLAAVLRAATPEFRALLVGYLMTAQRGGDVTRFAPAQYDRARRTLDLAQEKTGAELLIHVPEHMAGAIEAMAGRHPQRLFVTPRGRPWTTSNAQETLARLLEQLRLPRVTLHGLRATGPVVLKMLGFDNWAIRTLTGHTSDRNLELYLRGVASYPLARQAQQALSDHFGPLLDEIMAGSNQRRFTGATGRAARASGKSVENGKSGAKEGALTD